jgi:hypothetical protein
MFCWVRNPFNPRLETLHILLKGKEELAGLINDRTVQMKFNELGLGEYWIYTKKVYLSLTKSALSVSLPFLTSYLCEIAFSALNEIKNKKKERLINVEEELRVALSKILPRIDTVQARHHFKNARQTRVIFAMSFPKLREVSWRALSHMPRQKRTGSANERRLCGACSFCLLLPRAKKQPFSSFVCVVE